MRSFSNWQTRPFRAKPALVSGQFHLIEPDVVWFLLVVAIHLERSIYLLERPVRLIPVIGIDVVSLVADSQTDVVNLITDTFHIPHQMNPCIRRKWLAIIDGGLPPVHIVPNIPFAGIIEAAFRSPYPAIASKSLIDIKFQRLRSIGIVNVEVEVVYEMAHIIAARDGIEVQHVGICSRASHGELRRFPVHGGSRLILRHRGIRRALSRRADLSVSTRAGGE